MATDFQIIGGQLVTGIDPCTRMGRLVTHLYHVLAHLKSYKEACNHPRSWEGPFPSSLFFLIYNQHAEPTSACLLSRGLQTHEVNPCLKEAFMSIVRGLQALVDSRIYEASCEGALPLRSLI